MVPLALNKYNRPLLIIKKRQTRIRRTNLTSHFTVHLRLTKECVNFSKR